MEYFPQKPDPDPRKLPVWIDGELRRLQKALAGAWKSIRFAVLGVAPSKTNDGDVAYANGTDWNPGYGQGVYIYLGTYWKRFAMGGRVTANVSASDTVTAAASNNSFIAFAQTYSIPASVLQAGSALKAKALVVVNNASGTDTLTVEMRIGGTSLIATTAVDPGATTDLHLLEFEFTARAAPSAATSCVGAGRWITNTGGTIAHGTGLLAPTNFATNGALTLDVRAKWSSNTANTSARLEMLNVEIT